MTLSQAHISEPPITISQLAAQQERIKKREVDIKAKRAKIRAFHGLPPVRLYVYIGKLYADSFKIEPKCGTHATERSTRRADGADQAERAHSWQNGRRRLITPLCASTIHKSKFPAGFRSIWTPIAFRGHMHIFYPRANILIYKSRQSLLNEVRY